MNQCQKQGFHYCPNCDNQIADPRMLEQQLQRLKVIEKCALEFRRSQGEQRDYINHGPTYDALVSALNQV